MRGDQLVMALDVEGFAVSSGSACTAGDTEPSHVLLAMGLDRATAIGSLRVTVGRGTTEEDIRLAAEVTARVVERMRTDGAAA